jgi:hypothetical protein
MFKTPHLLGNSAANRLIPIPMVGDVLLSYLKYRMYKIPVKRPLDRIEAQEGAGSPLQAGSEMSRD